MRQFTTLLSVTDFGATRYEAARGRPVGGALPQEAQGRRGGSRTAAGAGGRTTPVRLPAAAGDGQTQGTAHEPEEGLPAVSRGGACGSPAAWSQARDRR